MNNDIQQILKAMNEGDQEAAKQLLPAVYEDLRRLASAKLAREAPGQTLQATALVHEAYLRVTKSDEQRWDHRGHFFMAVAEAMRRILVDNARRKRRVKAGGEVDRVGADLGRIEGPQKDDELLALEEALEKLSAEQERKAQIVKLRYFVGLTLEEAAEVLDISLATANRDWTYARAWLRRELSESEPGEP